VHIQIDVTDSNVVYIPKTIKAVCGSLGREEMM